MCGNQHIEHVIIAAKDAIARLGQFHPEQDRHTATDDPRENREDKVHRADVLVVGRINVTAPAGRMMIVCVFCCAHKKMPSGLTIDV